ncbi:hypothetical protein TNCV_592061 [Trichonephila clavipes]|nr:hypothetical protein TNCV_592061 [Trichonephila clavipes]
MLLWFPIPLEQESLHQVHLTFPRNSLTHQALLFIQVSQGNAPEVQKMSRRSKERAGEARREQGQVKKDFTHCMKWMYGMYPNVTPMYEMDNRLSTWIDDEIERNMHLNQSTFLIKRQKIANTEETELSEM